MTGALPKQYKPQKHPGYISWLHDQPCIVTGRKGVHAHHLTNIGHGRITRNDRYAVPLAPEMHQNGPLAVHVLGWEKFEDVHGIDLVPIANRLWEEYHEENG